MCSPQTTSRAGALTSNESHARVRSRPSEIPVPASPLRLILLLAISHVSFGGARLAISLQALHLQASPITVGLLMSLMMLVPTFVAVPIGRWVDRAGYRKPAAISLGGVVSALLVGAAVPSVTGLVVTSVMVGSSFMIGHVAVNNAIGHLAGASGRTRAFGLMAVAFSLSALIGPMLAGIAIDQAGYRWAFALLALPAAAVSLLLLNAPPMPPRDAPPPRERKGVADLLRLPRLRAVLIVSAMVSAGWDLFTFLVPLHGANSGLSATAIGFVAGAFGVGSATVRLMLPWIGRRVSEWNLIAAALVLSAAGYMLFPFCTTAATMVPLAFALGLVLGSGQPTVMSLLHVAAPPNRTGEAVGLRSAMISLGQTILPLGFGALGTAVGMAPLFWGIALLMGAGGAYAGRRRHLA